MASMPARTVAQREQLEPLVQEQRNKEEPFFLLQRTLGMGRRQRLGHGELLERERQLKILITISTHSILPGIGGA